MRSALLMADFCEESQSKLKDIMHSLIIHVPLKSNPLKFNLPLFLQITRRLVAEINQTPAVQLWLCELKNKLKIWRAPLLYPRLSSSSPIRRNAPQPSKTIVVELCRPLGTRNATTRNSAVVLKEKLKMSHRDEHNHI
ncbi:hypothetical protein CBL_06087 [Carabus blaptoides fortunei]